MIVYKKTGTVSISGTVPLLLVLVQTAVTEEQVPLEPAPRNRSHHLLLLLDRIT